MRLDQAAHLSSGCVFKNQHPSMKLALNDAAVPQWSQADRCDNAAVGWLRTSTGIRRYLCEEHAALLFRYGDDPEDVEDYPRGDLCDGCAKPTLHTDLDVKGQCPDCSTEADPSPPAGER